MKWYMEWRLNETIWFYQSVIRFLLPTRRSEKWWAIIYYKGHYPVNILSHKNKKALSLFCHKIHSWWKMNVRHPIFNQKYFYGKIDLRIFYFHVIICFLQVAQINGRWLNKAHYQPDHLWTGGKAIQCYMKSCLYQKKL